MKIIALSDLHGNLINIKETFDLMLICGDICPSNNHKRQYQYNWLITDFAEWVNNLPYNDDNSKVILIAGNHDFWFESISKTKENKFLSFFNDRLIYLNNTEYIHVFNDKEYHIFGCPYCKELKGWAFCKPYDSLDKYYSFIPNNIDILMTHEAPDIDGLGITTEGYNKNVNFGNEKLKNVIDITKPKYAFCGHIHTGKHDLRKYNDTTYIANVSILNENYNINYKPLIFNYE